MRCDSRRRFQVKVTGEYIESAGHLQVKALYYDYSHSQFSLVMLKGDFQVKSRLWTSEQDYVTRLLNLWYWYPGCKLSTWKQRQSLYVKFMMAKTDCSSGWAKSFHNYLLAKHRLEREAPQNQYPVTRVPPGSQTGPKELMEHQPEWNYVHGTPTSSESRALTSPAVRVTGSKRASTDVEERSRDQMATEMDSAMIASLQAQIAILQRELNVAMQGAHNHETGWRSWAIQWVCPRKIPTIRGWAVWIQERHRTNNI